MSLDSKPEWLDEQNVVAVHDLTIAVHGGLPGVRDQGALESALARPLNKWSTAKET